MRLDIALQQKYPNLNYSRTYWQSLIAGGKVKVGKLIITKANFDINENDFVKILISKDIEHKARPVWKAQITVLYEDKDIIIVDKPVGVPVHSDSIHSHESMLSAVQNYLGSQHYLRLAHRLDKETSGVLVLTKTPQSTAEMADIFADRKVIKQYSAVILGVFNKDHSLVDYLRYDNVMQKQFIASYGDLAESKIDDLHSSTSKKYTQVDLTIHTGRKHQIRVQLASRGFPVVGDKKYGGINASRMMLHARRIVVPQRNIDVESRLPKEFTDLMKL